MPENEAEEFLTALTRDDPLAGGDPRRPHRALLTEVLPTPWTPHPPPVVAVRLLVFLGQLRAGRLGDRSAVPALEAALGAERNDQVRSAILDALEALGQGVAQYLSAEALLNEAERAAGKAVPVTLGWLDWRGLPAVRWAPPRVGTAPAAVVPHLVVQAAKEKGATPGARHRHGVGLIDQADRAGSVGRCWRPGSRRTPDRKHRRRGARGCWRSSRRPVPPVLLHRRPLPAEWQGRRPSQAKALLALLAALGDPESMQVILGTARRFRAPGVQDEAARLAAYLAARHGWSVEERADRTIPTGGFDDDGRLTLVTWSFARPLTR